MLQGLPSPAQIVAGPLDAAKKRIWTEQAAQDEVIRYGKTQLLLTAAPIVIEDDDEDEGAIIYAANIEENGA